MAIQWRKNILLNKQWWNNSTLTGQKKKKEHPRSIDTIQHIKLNGIKKRTHILILIVTEKALEKNRKPIHDESSYECQKGISTT